MATTIPAGFATADNTGVPSGTTLTAYTGPMTITTNGTVIENKIINGALDITGANVTIRNCIITYNDFFAIDVRGVNVTVENCTIIGPGYNGDSPAAISADVGGGTFLNNDISGAEHGIVLGSGSAVVKGNYIHDGGSNKADPHIGGISLKGGQNNVLIEGNTVILGSDATSDIFLQNNWGPISNVTINHNYLAGDPGYDIYVEGRLSGGPVTGISITNNVIVKGHYGDYSIVDASPTMSGNVVFPAGTTVPNDPTPTTPPASTPPTAPTIASFSQDSGVVGDHITNDSTLTLTGTAAANGTVKVFDGATQIGTAAANSSGAWSYTTSALSDGSHNLTATVTNASGQTSTASTTLAAKIDTTAPNAPTIATASNNASGAANLATLAAANLTGTAETNSTVKVFDGTTQIGTATANGSGVWSFATDALTTGSHSFTAKAMDAAGNTGAASAAAVVDIAAPTTAPGAPTVASFSNDSGVVGDHITNDNTLTLTGTATANSSVKVFDGSTQVGTTTANSSGAWSLTTSTLVDGSHSLTATTTTTSTPGTSPTVFEDFNPWSGNVSPDGIWRIAGTWSGTGGNTLQPGNVSFTNTYPGERDTGFVYLTVPAGSPLRGAELQSLTTPGYSYGYYEARIKTTDVKSGGVVSFFWIEQPNYGSHEWDVEFTLSDSWAGTTNPGRVSFTTHPLDNTQWVNLGFNPSQAFHDYGFLWTPGRIDFTVDGQIVRTVTDPNLKTDATGYIMMNTWSGVSNFGGGPPSQDATSVYDWVKFYAGATSIPADNTGSTGGTSTSTPFSVTIDTAAPSAPTIAASTSAANLASTRVEVLTGTAEANSTVTVFDGATKLGTATAGSNGAWSYTTAALSTGSHSFTAQAMDVAGNTGVASAAVPVTVLPTSTAPGAPTIVSFSSDSGVVGDGITNDSTLALAGTAAANSTVKIFDGTAEIGTVTANSSGSWDYITSVLNDAKHMLTAKATDASGQTSATSSVLAVTIDTKAPDTPVLVSDSVVNTNHVLLSGTAEANSTLTVYDGTTAVGTATAGTNGAWSVTTSALLAGSKVLTATATDAAGNTSAHSAGADAVVPGSAQPLPNLSEHVFLGSTTLAAGSSTTVSTFVANYGNGPSAASTAHIYLSTDATITILDTLLATVNSGALTAVGQTGYYDHQTLSVTLPANLAPGTYYIGGIADYNNQVSESYETDNTYNVTQVTVPASPAGGAPASAVELTDVSKSSLGIVTLKGTADASSDIQILDETNVVGTVTSANDGTWSFASSSAVSNTVHTFKAQELDSTGHAGAGSGSAILGSTGGNTLTSTAGNDLFVGNGSHDTFVFAPNFGNDVINDFSAGSRGHDVIQFSMSVFDSFASVLAHATQVGQDVVIAADATDSLTLKNVKLAALDKTDFHFA
jgi:beta-glucanase (GH16 family)